MDAFTYRKMMPCGSGPGRMYGMAKQHKAGCPLRPVNSMIGTAEYDLAKWLDSYIKLYLPNDHSINSTKNFIDKLKSHLFSANGVCVSFDVESLFTNVPQLEIINDIVGSTYTDSYLFPTPEDSNAKRLSKPVFIKLPRLCTEGIFLYKDNIYINKLMAMLWVSPWAPH